jgi:hypothetical protein
MPLARIAASRLRFERGLSRCSSLVAQSARATSRGAVARITSKRKIASHDRVLDAPRPRRAAT